MQPTRNDRAGFSLVELLVKPFAAFLDAGLELHYFGSGGILLPAVGLTLLVGVVSVIGVAVGIPTSVIV